MNEEVEAAKKRGYVIFKTDQKASRLGPYSRWCKEMLKPQIYVQITGKSCHPINPPLTKRYCLHRSSKSIF